MLQGHSSKGRIFAVQMPGVTRDPRTPKSVERLGKEQLLPALEPRSCDCQAKVSETNRCVFM
jgi:hypothetical protein